MRITLSLPDDVFRAAERHARRAKKSRNRLYSEAVSEYLARHAADEVTEAMDRVIKQIQQSSDMFVSRGGRRILERAEW